MQTCVSALAINSGIKLGFTSHVLILSLQTSAQNIQLIFIELQDAASSVVKAGANWIPN